MQDLELGQLGSSPVLTTSCLYDLENRPSAGCASQFPPLYRGDKILFFLPLGRVRIQEVGEEEEIKILCDFYHAAGILQVLSHSPHSAAEV